MDENLTLLPGKPAGDGEGVPGSAWPAGDGAGVPGCAYFTKELAGGSRVCYLPHFVMDEREAYIALNMMEKIGPVGVRSLVETLGTAAAIFEADGEALGKARGVGRETVQTILAQRESLDWEGELQRAEAMGARLVARVDSEYPESLREIHDPPLALYIRGSLESRDSRGVAVVGTRRPTHYGRESAQRLANGLARSGLTIVSGLATGIDTVAHEAALAAGGRTVAVLGGGLDCLYPPANAGLADRIADGCGAVISEFPLGRRPDKTTFPMRNRIVSGMSRGVLVVEAGPRSGALITADQALEQGRSVWAVPGRVDSSRSAGPHWLIQQGAKLVTCVGDVLEEWDDLFPATAAPTATPPGTGGLSADESALLTALGESSCDVDTLIRASGLKPGAVSAVLLGLEMRKLVRMLPGRMVERIR